MTDCNGKEYEIIDVGGADNIIGKQFGALTVVNRVKILPKNEKAWLCVCKNCGNEICVSTGHLNNGNTKSCGCRRKKENPLVVKILEGLIDELPGDN